MLTELQIRKLTRMFHVYDVNHNGVIERADYELLAQNSTRAMGYPPGSPDYEALHTQFMASWDGLQQFSDTDKDGRITLEEFLAVHDFMMAEPERCAAVITGIVKTLFWLWDRDKDGKVSEAEHDVYLVAFDAMYPEAGEIFRRLDRDSDGYLSYAELQQNTEEFFLSNDPEAIGNWSLGPY